MRLSLIIAQLTNRPSMTAATPSVSFPKIPGYQVTGFLGRGGMGCVYQATNLQLGREVAVKLLVDKLDDELVTRFESEARSIAHLDHPNIARLYDYLKTEDGSPVCVMELVTGGSLADQIKGRPVVASEAATIVETLARAIAYSHEQGIVHRDLKPGNVLVVRKAATSKTEAPNESSGAKTPSSKKGARHGNADSSKQQTIRPGDLKIVDFGLAKSTQQDAGVTRTGQILGTPAYMAPEQASGVFSRVGPAADIYSLGAILYELLAGRPPFLANDSVQTLMMLMFEEPVPPRMLNAAIPHDLQTICLKCLEKKPSRRFETAGDLADDLRRWLDNKPILSRPATWYAKVWKWTRRNPWQAVAANLVIAIAIGSLVASLYLRTANKTILDTNARLANTNSDLKKAITESNSAFELSRNTLDQVVGKLRDELFEVPQGQQLMDSTAVLTAELYKKLHELRPEDIEVCKSTIFALKVVWYADWLAGRREKSREQEAELKHLIDTAIEKWPGDVWLATQRIEMDRSRLDELDPVAQADEFDQRAVVIDEGIRQLLLRFGKSPDVFKIASAWYAALHGTAVERGDIELARADLQKRVEYADRFAAASMANDAYAKAWLVQALCSHAEFELIVGNSTGAEDPLNRAMNLFGNAATEKFEDRESRYWRLETERLMSQFLRARSDLTGSLDLLEKAEYKVASLIKDFPDDFGYRTKAVELLYEQGVILNQQERFTDARQTLGVAIEQVDNIIADQPNHANAIALRDRIETLLDSIPAVKLRN